MRTFSLVSGMFVRARFHFIAKYINWMHYCPLTAAWSLATGASDLHTDSARGRARVTASPSLPYLLFLSLSLSVTRDARVEPQPSSHSCWELFFGAHRIAEQSFGPAASVAAAVVWQTHQEWKCVLSHSDILKKTPSATNDATDVGISKYRQTFRGCPSCFPPHWSLFLRFPR